MAPPISTSASNMTTTLADRLSIPEEWRRPLLYGLAAVATGSVCAYLYWDYMQHQDDEASSSTSNESVSKTTPMTQSSTSNTAAPKVAVVPPSQRDAQASPKKGPQTAKSLKLAGNDYFKKGEYEAAEKNYSEAIDLALNANKKTGAANSRHKAVDNADLSVFYQNRAAAREKLNKVDEALADCCTSIEYNKLYKKAYTRRAKLYEQTNTFDKALLDLTVVCILESFGNADTLGECDRILKRVAEFKAKELLKARGDNFVVPLSVSFVESYLMSFCDDPILDATNPAKGYRRPDSSEPLEGLDLAYELLSKRAYEPIYDACTKEINEPINHDRLLHALALRATFNLIQGRTKQATDDFAAFFGHLNKLDDAEREALKKLIVNVYIKRGSFHMQSGNKEAAMQDFELAQKVDGENADVYHHRGQLLMLVGDNEGARNDFKRCTELRPDFDVARVQSGYADYRLAAQGQSTAALNNSIVKLESIVNDFPQCAEGYSLLGQVYAERESYADAREMFDKAVALQKSNANIYVHMGLLELARTEDLEKGKRIIEKAIDIDPHCEFAYETIGNLEVQRGNIGMAIEYFDRALNLARTELELVHVIGMREAACAQLHAAKTLGFEMAFPGPGS